MKTMKTDPELKAKNYCQKCTFLRIKGPQLRKRTWKLDK